MQDALVPYHPPHLPVDPDESETMVYRAGTYLMGIELGSAPRLHLGQQQPGNLSRAGWPYAPYTRVGHDRTECGGCRHFLPAARHGRAGPVPGGCRRTLSDFIPPGLASPARSSERGPAGRRTASGGRAGGLVDRRDGACQGARTCVCDRCSHPNTSGATATPRSGATARRPHSPGYSTRPRRHPEGPAPLLRAATSAACRDAPKWWRGSVGLPLGTGWSR